jgi:predicted RNA-binding protein associated with RNAse of E/G family
MHADAIRPGRRRVVWDGRKWPNRLHWQFEASRLGDDEHGTWLSVPAGSTARRAHEPPLRIPHAFVSLVPPDTWWNVEFYPTHPLWELYVNIGTPCEWHGSTIRQVDLDLDVVRTVTGAIEVLDEDEFADHQLRFGYPADLVDGARRATDKVIDLLDRRVEPFGSAAQRWLATAGLARTD